MISLPPICCSSDSGKFAQRPEALSTDVAQDDTEKWPKGEAGSNKYSTKEHLLKQHKEF
jgi:hypothetical protein